VIDSSSHVAAVFLLSLSFLSVHYTVSVWCDLL